MTAHGLKLIFFAEEVGLVHRHGINKVLKLFPGRLKTHEGKITFKQIVAGLLHALFQPFINEVSFGIFEVNAGFPVEH